MAAGCATACAAFFTLLHGECRCLNHATSVHDHPKSADCTAAYRTRAPSPPFAPQVASAFSTDRWHFVPNARTTLDLRQPVSMLVAAPTDRPRYAYWSDGVLHGSVASADTLASLPARVFVHVPPTAYDDISRFVHAGNVSNSIEDLVQRGG